MTFFELEKECKKRKVKRWLKAAFLIFLLTVSVYFVIKFFYPEKKTELKKQPEKIVKKEKNSSKPVKIIKTVKKEILKPVIDLNVSEEKKEKTIPEKREKNKSEKNVVILNTSSLPSFDTCILLAEKYYKNRDYEKALKWAENANIQNKKNPKSWIIVAKSLYKMGKKDKALKILEIFYKYTKNKKALELIKRIKNDKNL